jgi:hypothetical protein
VAFAVTGAAVLLGGAIPAIAAASNGPVIYYACVTNGTGAIKIVSASAKCQARQRKISWNKVGPRGAIGAQGPPGVVTGYQGTQVGPFLLGSSGFVSVDILRLPAGHFLVVARAEADISGTGASDAVVCDLVDGNQTTVLDSSTVTVSQNFGMVGVTNLMLTGLTSMGGNIRLECTSNDGTAVIGTYSQTIMTAIPVTSVVTPAGATRAGKTRRPPH